MFTMKSKVWILNSRKQDGRYNKGIIVGIELDRPPTLGYRDESQFFRDFKEGRYKVAYVDVFTNKACVEWFHCTNLSKTSPP